MAPCASGTALSAVATSFTESGVGKVLSVSLLCREIELRPNALGLVAQRRSWVTAAAVAQDSTSLLTQNRFADCRLGRDAMVNILLDGEQRSLELPKGVLSMKSLKEFVKQRTGAALCIMEWRGAPTIFDQCLDSVGYADPCTGMPAGAGCKRRLFLSARGWRSSHELPSVAQLFALGNASAAMCMLEDDELPSLLAMSSNCKCLAFTMPQVTVDLPGGGFVEVGVKEGTTGLYLRAYVAAVLEEEPQRVLLEAERGRSVSDIDLQSQGIMPGSRLTARVVDCCQGSIQVLVKTLTGKTITIDCHPYNTVADMKHGVFQKEGILPDDQRMILAGKQLEDNNSLASYGISDDCTIHLVLRLRGGMFHFTSGREGDFSVTPLAGFDGQAELARIAAAGRVPVEVVLPDSTAVLLECGLQDDHARVLQRLRDRLSQQTPDVTEVDVDRIQDIEELRRLLREAQQALSRSRT